MDKVASAMVMADPKETAGAKRLQAAPAKHHRWTEVLVSSDEVEAFELAGAHVLFHAGSQQLTVLNETAAWVWAGLTNGYLGRDIVADLRRRGLTGEQAADFVESILAQWLAAGWIHPGFLAEHLSEPAQTRVSLSIVDVGIAVLLRGSRVPDGLNDLLSPLRGEAPIQHELNVIEWADGFILVVDGQCRGFLQGEAIVPAVKAALTERLTRSMNLGFFAHGALLDGPTGRIFLSGPPASGKSTLAVALFEAGFRCLSDDVVRIDPSGRATGAPFAATLKAGAWPLFPGLATRIEALPVHRRADGQAVRYLPTVISPGERRCLDAFIVLQRSTEGLAGTEPVSGLDALKVLLTDAFATKGCISGEQMKGLAQAFAATRCCRLHYKNLADAVSVIQRIGHVES